MNWGDDVENKFPKRKKLRMEDYNYNGDGAYFVTICTQNRQKILSKIVGDGALDVPHIKNVSLAGGDTCPYVNLRYHAGG